MDLQNEFQVSVFLFFKTKDRKQEPVERPAIARGIGTLIYFKRFTGTVVLQSFVFGL